MTRNCDVCGRSYEAKHPRSKFCGDNCRKRNSRGSAVISPPTAQTVEDASLVDAVRAELDAAGRLDSATGRQALRLAQRMCGQETGGGMAALNRELRATMAEALQNAVTAADPLDELKARRDAKRGA